MAANRKQTNFNLLLIGLVVAGIVLTVYATQNFRPFNSKAAGSKTTQEASISLVETEPRLGDYVHFTYVLPKGVKEEPIGNGTQARIQVLCYQNGELVYGVASNAIDANITGTGIQLGGAGSIWLTVGGPADCVATLYQWTYRGSQAFNPFAETSFLALGN